VFQEGALSVNGKKLLHDSPAAMRDLRQQVGMIFQSFNLFPLLSVGRNVMLAPTLVKARSPQFAAMAPHFEPVPGTSLLRLQVKGVETRADAIRLCA
jgi:ABC-type polar amino acid transport system ATPase subunit